MYHTEMISLRLPVTTLERLDQKRGSTKRGAYIRHLIEKDLGDESVRSNADELRALREKRNAGPKIEEPVAEQIVAQQVKEQPRHLHKFVKGEHVGFHQGTKTYRYDCACGKWDVR